MEVDTRKYNALPEGTQNLSPEEIIDALGKCRQEAQQFCSKMEDLGEESVIMSVNVVSKAVTYLGSNVGRDFLRKRLDIIDSFFGFCNEAYSRAVAESPKSIMTSNRSLVKTNESITKSPIKSKIATIQSPSGSATTPTQSPTKSGKIPNSTQSPSQSCQSLDHSPSKIGLTAKQLLQNTVYDSVISGPQNKPAKKSICEDVMKSQSPLMNVTTNEYVTLHHLHDRNINFNDLYEVNEREKMNTDLIALDDNKIISSDLSDASKKEFSCNDLNGEESEEYFTQDQKNVSNVSSHIKKNGRDSLQRETNSAIVVLEKLMMKNGKLENVKDHVLDGNKIIQKVEKVTDDVREENIYAGNSDYNMDTDIGLFEQTIHTVRTTTADSKSENKTFVSRRSGRKRKTPNYKKMMNAEKEHDPDWEIKNKIIDVNGKKRRKGKARPTHCDLRGQTFKDQTGFVQHMAKHADDKSFKCEVCEKQFINSGLYRIHVNAHSKCEQYVCDICGKPFKTMGRLTLHRNTQHIDGQELLCLTCGKKFKCKSDFKRHSMIHTDNKPHSCDICQKRFYRIAALNRHRFIHMVDKPFKCEYCQKQFALKSNYQIHLQCHTSVPVECDVCGKVFTAEERLKAHQKTHTTLLPYECTVCGKCFKMKYYLKCHMQVHEKTGKKYVCEICGKQYSMAKYLTVHKQVHRDDSIYRCLECGKEFNLMRKLSLHLQIHTNGERPYVCDICGKSFPIPLYLKRHEKTHLGLKPFQCNLCGQKFTAEKSVRRHHLRVHTKSSTE